MLGEEANAEFFDAIQDFRNRPGGDDRIDLEVLLDFWDGETWFENDVKAARFPKNLVVNAKKVVPYRIYILAGAHFDPHLDEGTVCDADHGELLGWEFGHQMILEPVHVHWMGNDADVHLKERHRLRRMEELKSYYCRRWRHHGLEARDAFSGTPPLVERRGNQA